MVTIGQWNDQHVTAVVSDMAVQNLDQSLHYLEKEIEYYKNVGGDSAKEVALQLGSILSRIQGSIVGSQLNFINSMSAQIAGLKQTNIQFKEEAEIYMDVMKSFREQSLEVALADFSDPLTNMTTSLLSQAEVFKRESAILEKELNRMREEQIVAREQGRDSVARNLGSGIQRKELEVQGKKDQNSDFIRKQIYDLEFAAEEMSKRVIKDRIQYQRVGLELLKSAEETNISVIALEKERSLIQEKNQQWVYYFQKGGGASAGD